MNSASTERAPPSFARALAFWFQLGWISFGGPAGQIALMHSELVGRRRWIDDGAFVRALGYCMLLPGPEAMQLATWIGWRLHGIRGGLAAGALFVLPAALVLALLSWAYLHHGETRWMAGALFGLGAAVLAMLGQALLRLGRRVLVRPFARGLAVATLVASLAGVAFPWILAAAALAGWAVSRFAPGWLATDDGHGAAAPIAVPTRPPRRRKALLLALALLAAWWVPLLAVAALLGPDSTTWRLGAFFSQAALVTFGGAYAVLPYVADQAVAAGWLGEAQMLAGLSLAETTPGPLVIVLEFVGFVGGWQHPDLASPLASALLGAAVTVWATFLPSFLFVLPAAPWIEGLHRHPGLAAAMAGVTAAVVGVIAKLAGWFAWHYAAGLDAASLAVAAVLVAAAWWAFDRRLHVLGVVVLLALAGTAWRLVVA